jgi:hypothetical protein
MLRLEVFILETGEEAGEAEFNGLVTFDGSEECANCEEPVGLVDGSHVPCVLIVDDEADDYWFTCIECAEPVIDPEPDDDLI